MSRIGDRQLKVLERCDAASRTSRVTYTAERYDYEKQAWIGADGRYLSCAHPREMNCQCYGRLHYGELQTVRGEKQ